MLKAQLHLANELEMPVVIHCRGAERQTFDILVEVFVFIFILFAVM